MFSKKIWHTQLDKVFQYHDEIQRNLSIVPSYCLLGCFLGIGSLSNSKKTTQQTVGWKDEQTQCHGTLPATARDSKSTTAVDWHLKVKDIEYDIGLTKNYCLTVSMKKSTEFVDSLFRYSRFQGFMNYMTTPISDLAHPNIIEITFTISEFTPAC